MKDIQKFSSQKLCEIVVASRYLGMARPEAISAMEELAARRAGGDSLAFEEEIASLLGKLPDYKQAAGIDLSFMAGLK